MAKDGQGDFLNLEILTIFGQFLGENFSDFENLFPPEIPKPNAILIHHRFDFCHSNLSSQTKFCPGGQNHPFSALNLDSSATAMFLASEPNFIC